MSFESITLALGEQMQEDHKFKVNMTEDLDQWQSTCLAYTMSCVQSVLLKISEYQYSTVNHNGRYFKIYSQILKHKHIHCTQFLQLGPARQISFDMNLYRYKETPHQIGDVFLIDRSFKPLSRDFLANSGSGAFKTAMNHPQLFFEII